MDCCLLHNRLPALIHQLLTIEAYRLHIAPLIVARIASASSSASPSSSHASLKLYLVLFHEASLCNLLELLLFHPSLLLHCPSDSLLELCDYCHRRLIALHSQQHFAPILQPAEEEDTIDSGAAAGGSEAERLRRQMLDVEFACSACAVSMLRYVTDQLGQLPLALISRLLHTQDVLLVLVPLLLHSPFTRRRRCLQPSSASKDGASSRQREWRHERFVDQQWQAVSGEDLRLLSRLDGQLWLCVHNLLLTPQCRSAYRFDTLRQETVLQLRPRFTAALLDQLPVLTQLQRCVEELSIVAPPPPTSASAAVIEQLPEIRDAVLLQCRDAQRLADDAFTQHFAPTADRDAQRQAMRELAEGLTAGWGAAGLGPGVPQCAECGEEADKRCSLCAEVWYCGRECQVAGWKRHKPQCEERRDERKKKEEERKSRDTERQKEKDLEREEEERQRSKGWKQAAARKPNAPLIVELPR